MIMLYQSMDVSDYLNRSQKMDILRSSFVEAVL